jgi:uncharacterized membrane protein
VAKAKITKKTNKTARSSSRKASQAKVLHNTSGLILTGSVFLFAAVCVILFANMQNDDALKLLFVGFGSALLVFGGALLGSAAKSK